MLNNKVKLNDLVNIKLLNEIQKKFTEVTGIRACITDARGKPLTDMGISTSFCRYIRFNSVGCRRCEETDMKRGLEAMERGKPFYYTCHAGLIDAVAPIIFNNEFMGAFLFGQVLLTSEHVEPEDVWSRNCDLGLDKDVLLKHLAQIETVSAEKLMTALEMMVIMVNYIVEMGISNMTQKQLMSEMKAKSELERNLRETEYKALLSQINPHFLFNCLNTIGRVAFCEEAYKTQELIYSLSDILRSILKDSEKIVTLKEEIKYVEDYLRIQKVRFGDRIKVNFDIDRGILYARLPKFTLQPLVENAIIHGLEPKVEGGTLTISGSREADKVIIRIDDTGVGMPRFKIEEVINRNTDKTGHVTGLGIINVQKRVQYYFGEDFGLKFDCRLNKGCTVTVTIPYYE